MGIAVNHFHIRSVIDHGTHCGLSVMLCMVCCVCCVLYIYIENNWERNRPTKIPYLFVFRYAYQVNWVFMTE